MFGRLSRKWLETTVKDLEARVEALELRGAEERLALFELVDKVSHRMDNRHRMRGSTQRRAEEGDELDLDAEGDHALGYARRFGKARED